MTMHGRTLLAAARFLADGWFAERQRQNLQRRAAEAQQREFREKQESRILQLTREQKKRRREIIIEWEVGYDEIAAFHKLSIRQTQQINEVKLKSLHRKQREEEEERRRDIAG